MIVPGRIIYTLSYLKGHYPGPSTFIILCTPQFYEDLVTCQNIFDTIENEMMLQHDIRT